MHRRSRYGFAISGQRGGDADSGGGQWGADVWVGACADVGERSGGYFDLKEGSLYPALHRLERQKLLRSSWREADGRRRKYYELTKAGRTELASRKKSWLSFTAGVNGVLGTN